MMGICSRFRWDDLVRFSVLQRWPKGGCEGIVRFTRVRLSWTGQTRCNITNERVRPAVSSPSDCFMLLGCRSLLKFSVSCARVLVWAELYCPSRWTVKLVSACEHAGARISASRSPSWRGGRTRRGSAQECRNKGCYKLFGCKLCCLIFASERYFSNIRSEV